MNENKTSRVAFERRAIWIDGAVWLNGPPIGRYWEVGPAKTLYLPGCWMRKGANRLVVFETERLLRGRLRLVDKPELGPPTLRD